VNPELVISGMNDMKVLGKSVSLFRIWGQRPEFPSARRVQATGLVRRWELPGPTLLTKLHQGCINGGACQPGCKTRSFIETLKMDESTQKTIVHCIFRVFTVPTVQRSPRLLLGRYLLLILLLLLADLRVISTRINTGDCL
jgi:hypothetical protein